MLVHMYRKCPRCGHEDSGELLVRINDGGSLQCNHCRAIYHFCNGQVRYGSPGPTLCPHCNPRAPTNAELSLTLFGVR